MLPSGWNADTALAGCPLAAWNGPAWRMHRRRYLATDPGGSLRVSGRYNRGLDQFPSDQAWPALYLALGRDVCIGEVARHLTSASMLSQLNDYRISELAIALDTVLDCRDLSGIGLTLAHLCHDTNYAFTQALAGAALRLAAEGLLVPSCTRLGNNLILFPTQLRPTSRIEVVSSVDPRLHIPR